MSPITYDTSQHKSLQSCDKAIRAIGLFLVLMIFVIFGGWAALAPLASATISPAVVEVKSHRKTIQHLTGGVIKEIHIEDGDLVNEGDVLVTLDGTDLKTQYDVLVIRFYEAQAKLARLKAELLDGITEIPDSLKPSITDPDFIPTWKLQQEAFRARKAAREGEIAILKNQTAQAHQKIERLIRLSGNRGELADSLNIDLKDYNKLVRQGYFGQKNLREFVRKAIEYDGERDDLKAEAKELEVQIDELELRMHQINHSFREEVLAEIESVKEKIYELSQQQLTLDQQLSRLEITAPSSGRVMDMQVHTLGGVISAGQKIMEIVPNDDELILAAKLSPEDIENISPGQDANIRLTTFNSPDTPEVKGTVLTVSADRLLNSDNEAYFEAKISIKKEDLEKAEEMKLVAGMSAEVLILNGSRTFIEYLLKPLTDSISRSFIER